MDWKERPVFITGAGGFIGSHLTERLLALGARVTAMVNGDPQFKPGYLRGLDHTNLRIIGGDLRDGDFLRRSIVGHDTVFHLGAVTSVQYSYAHPEEAIAVNTLGTQHVCAACREAKVRRLVHTSTAGIYGNAKNNEPIDEGHPVAAHNPYTAGKLGGDFVAETYFLSYDLPVVIARNFNVYGPRMGRFLIMPTIIQQLLAGSEVRLGDLRPTRTFIYVSDVVEAYLAIATTEGVEGELIHFGTPEVVSMGELLEKIAAIIGREYRLIQDPSKMRPAKSEIYRQHVNCAKAERLLAWRPRVKLSEGLRETVQWIESGGYGKA
jgi:nucleoside-diphosphate-sugar epimerase